MSDKNKVFQFTNYKQFVIQELQQRPRRGHGQFLKIAKALNVHTTMVTHILKGSLHLNPEQCLALAEYLGLSELETEFFVNLVQLARAGDLRTKKYFEKKRVALKTKALNLSDRLEVKNSLSESDQAIFYSSWIYSAIRLLTAIPEFQTRSAIADELNLSHAKLNPYVEFLLSRGLCEESGGQLTYGNVKTYVGQESPLVARHHTNWRMKVLEQVERLKVDELAYTYPVVISESDFAKIREELVQFIERFNRIAKPSPSERLCCLNIDWVQVQKSQH